MSQYENVYDNNTNFNNNFSTLIENIHTNNFDENLFKNISNNENILNKNLFSDLHHLFINEQDRIFNIFNTDTDINSIIEKISIDMNNVDINYDPDKILQDLDNEKKNSDLQNFFENKFKLNLSNFLKTIENIRNYYKELFIETINLEIEIKNILKKYDKQYNLIKKLYQSLSELDDLDEHLNKIDFEINTYVKNYFEKNDLLNKLKKYKDNTDKLKYLKIQINKLNSINFVPTCNICMNNIVDTVLIPCGHTCCSECIQQLNQHCFVCRSEYNNLKQLFIN